MHIKKKNLLDWSWHVNDKNIVDKFKKKLNIKI